MAITHVDGDFFGPEHSAGHKGFGFAGSVGEGQASDHNTSGRARATDKPVSNRAAPSESADENTQGYSHIEEPEQLGEGHPGDYATGGEVGPHPHGDLVTSSMEHPDGRFVEQHAHGGHTVYHPDGRITHHMHDGTPVGFPPMGGNTGGVEDMHDGEAEYAHRPRSGPPSPEDNPTPNRQMAKDAEGETDRGGLARGGRPRLPRDMRPMGMRPHSPIETPPRKPQNTTTPTNSMPGGTMPYGTQPSVEPGQADTDPTGATPPGMKRGGRAMVHDDDDDGE